MKPELERYLWDRTPQNDAFRVGLAPRTVIAEMLDKGMIQNAKQAWRTLEKWTKKGVYDYGVTLDLGWRENGAAFPGPPPAPRDPVITCTCSARTCPKCGGVVFCNFGNWLFCACGWWETDDWNTLVEKLKGLTQKP